MRSNGCLRTRAHAPYTETCAVRMLRCVHSLPCPRCMRTFKHQPCCYMPRSICSSTSNQSHTREKQQHIWTFIHSVQTDRNFGSNLVLTQKHVAPCTCTAERRRASQMMYSLQVRGASTRDAALPSFSLRQRRMSAQPCATASHIIRIPSMIS